MDTLKRHEIFEIEVLDRMKSGKFLDPLVFGGGTMLRLCYGLNRYSADLDFWFQKSVPVPEYFRRLKDSLSRGYEITDAKSKFYTLLVEVRSREYPKRLKIEIRKKAARCDFQERIAFSSANTRQVILRVHTLEQTMKNKVEAALDRNEIRDFFDIEFLLRQGIPLPRQGEKLKKLKKLALDFNDRDFKSTLGALLEPDVRGYYIKNRFEYLLRSISNLKP